MNQQFARALAGLSIALVVSGCGGEDRASRGPSADATSNETSSESNTETPAPAVSLRDVCPEIEAPLLADDEPLIPTYDTLEEMSSAALDGLVNGDTETKNAVEPFIDSLAPIKDHVRTGGMTGNMTDSEAARILIDALDQLARRCKAAGSSALQ
ncbi:hypothetical protein Q9S36_48575 [Microbacterium sp. ARD31]|uniref:hypothetical protein n=1 Tax=Microbacterium sp. ARD31 TaxID=2962576 RepID=UPI002880FE3A|nr:hypothetical protein [Microbacterium sp. ARD31]MDT0188071.1 hypothetical protein [Microbacterium sp. ARD31]